MSSATDGNKEIARRFMEDCWNQGKMDAFRELVSNDCRYHDSVFPSIQSGLDNIRQHIGNCRNGFPDLHFTIEDMIAEGDKVVCRNIWRWTDAASGKKMQFHGFVLWRFEGGKIAERWATVTPPAEETAQAMK